MKALLTLIYALALPFWLFGRLYSFAAKQPFTIRAFLLAFYAFPAIKLCEITGISMAWPVLWIPLISLAVAHIIDALISRLPDQPRNPAPPNPSAI